MAISVNRVQLVGRLGADPEARGREGLPVTLRVATSRSWRDKSSGEKREATQWHSVVVWAEQKAKFVSQYARKGDMIYVEGQLETRKWERGPGDDVYYTEVVVRPYSGDVQLQSRDGAGKSESQIESDRIADRERSTRQEGTPYRSGSFSHDLDDDIPF